MELLLENLPVRAPVLRVRHYRIDASHSNTFSVWKEMGSPQQPSPTQRLRLERAGQLEEMTPPTAQRTPKGEWSLTLHLPRHAVSLLEVSW